MLAFFAILLFTWLLGLFLPWWSVFIPAIMLGAWLFGNGLRAFLIGFSAAGLAWVLPALYIDIANENILSTRIAEMMQVGSPFVLHLITFLIGGLAGGLGTLLGYLTKETLQTTSATAPSRP